MLYIKLGDGGRWCDACIKHGVLKLGFWTGEADMHAACNSRDWDSVRALLRKKRGKTDQDSVEDDFRQVAAVFGDDGTTTWITFRDRKMYWAKLVPGSHRPSQDGDHSEHDVVGGWSSCTTDDARAELRLDDLAGHLGKVTQYRGTICAPERPDYVLRRIRGEETDLARRARLAVGELEDTIAAMITELTPYDFEILVDMVFSSSGWRREGKLGGTEEDVDLVIARGATGAGAGALGEERVAVQVKSRTNQPEFDRYAEKLLRSYSRGLYVFHTPTAADIRGTTGITLVDAHVLAPMVLDAGAGRWLLRRVR